MENTGSSGGSKFQLPETEIHIWRARLDCGRSLIQRMEETLAPDERERAGRFVFQPDRKRFIAARGILRELLGSYLGTSPAKIAFKYGSKGKPFLAEKSGEPGLEFNISHSRDIGLFAFTRGRRVGVDVEFMRADFGGEEIARRYFAEEEVLELQSLPPTSRETGFFLCWTRKEAYIKAHGDGLSIPLKSFHVSLTPDRPAILKIKDSVPWTLRSIDPGAGYAGAVVGEGKNWKLVCRDWQPE